MLVYPLAFAGGIFFLRGGGPEDGGWLTAARESHSFSMWPKVRLIGPGRPLLRASTNTRTLAGCVGIASGTAVIEGWCIGARKIVRRMGRDSTGMTR